MSTKSVSSMFFPNTTRERRTAASNTMPLKYFRNITLRSIARNCWRGTDFGQALQDGASAVFRDVETQLHARALDFQLRQLNEKKKIRIRELEQSLRFIADPRRQFLSCLRRFALQDQPGLDRIL